MWIRYALKAGTYESKQSGLQKQTKRAKMLVKRGEKQRQLLQQRWEIRRKLKPEPSNKPPVSQSNVLSGQKLESQCLSGKPQSLSLSPSSSLCSNCYSQINQRQKLDYQADETCASSKAAYSLAIIIKLVNFLNAIYCARFVIIIIISIAIIIIGIVIFRRLFSLNAALLAEIWFQCADKRSSFNEMFPLIMFMIWLIIMTPLTGTGAQLIKLFAKD